MDKIEIAVMKKFLNYALVTMHWFINRVEKKYPAEVHSEKLQELKELVKKLEQDRDEIERDGE